MDLQNQIEAALYNWVTGKRDDLKDFARNNPDILKTYTGRGDIGTYFLPCLYIKDFCLDLIEVDFPVEDIFERYPDDFMWVDWPQAVERVARYKSHLIKNLYQDGAMTTEDINDTDAFAVFYDFYNEDKYTLFDYWPRDIQELFEDNANKFLDSTQDQWNERFETISKASKNIQLKK